MKELRHIRRARPRLQAILKRKLTERQAWDCLRAYARAKKWGRPDFPREHETPDEYGMRAWVKWARRHVAAQPPAPDEQQPGESTQDYIRRALHAWRVELGMVLH
jgi:hypothetical protein